MQKGRTGPDHSKSIAETIAPRARCDADPSPHLRTYLERDIPQLGPRIAAETLRRFWTMLAHHQGGLLNVAQLARNVGVAARTAASLDRTWGPKMSW